MEIFYERAYLSTPGFGHSPRGKFMVELFKLLRITPVLALVGASMINLQPKFEDIIQW